ncbi:MAG: cell envelope integrity protein CreD [Saprospiraceae bacterium]|jgi:inner membrane protein
MENPSNSTLNRIGERLRSSLLVKLISIGFIALLLMIPQSMTFELIRERQNRQQEVVREISESWGGSQNIAGPVLTIPYTVWTEGQDGTKTASTHHLNFLPNELDIEGNARHEMRSRGIFDAILYRSNIRLSGKFEAPDLEALNISPQQLVWKEARVSLGISSMTGIRNSINLDWNGEKIRMEPGTANVALLPAGVSSPVQVPENQREWAFSIPLELNGTESLFFEPVGRITKTALKASWPSPSFTGKMLPDTREISEKGFSAAWKILDLNRNYPQQWKDNAYNFTDSAFGVRLIRPVDEYLKNERTAKYAILVIGLTFLIYFFFETLRKFRIHPFQYLLVGLALVVFYLLLLSLSEQIGFNAAYGLAAVATIGLISFYSASVLRLPALLVQLTILLGIIFGFIFIVLQLEDFALLAGSLGIFVALAAVMFYSRKVDWYNLE